MVVECAFMLGVLCLPFSKSKPNLVNIKRVGLEACSCITCVNIRHMPMTEKQLWNCRLLRLPVTLPNICFTCKWTCYLRNEITLDVRLHLNGNSWVVLIEGFCVSRLVSYHPLITYLQRHHKVGNSHFEVRKKNETTVWRLAFITPHFNAYNIS